MYNIKRFLVLGVILCLMAAPLTVQAGDEKKLTAPAGFTAGEFEEIMPDALKGYGGQIFDMEEKYGINGLFLLSVIRLESGNGESGLTKSKNNVAGNKAGGSYMSFDVLGEGIEYAAQNLSENYLNEDGRFYTNGTLDGIEKIYCPGGNWASQVRSIMNEYEAE